MVLCRNLHPSGASNLVKIEVISGNYDGNVIFFYVIFVLFRDYCQISLLRISESKRIYQLLSLLKSSFSDVFRGYGNVTLD